MSAMCRIWQWLCLLLLSSIITTGLALNVNVSSAAELRNALLDPGVGVVRILMAGDYPGIRINPAVFLPVSIDREVIITSVSRHAILDFGSAAEPFITVAAGGNLTLQGLTLSGFYPAAPLKYTIATAMMPIAAVTISSSSASLAVAGCIFLVEGAVADLTNTMPYWQAAAQQVNLEVDSSSAAQSQSTADAAADVAERSLVSSTAVPSGRVVALPPRQLVYWGGNSGISVDDNVLVLDPTGCYNGSTALAWDSASLFAALHDMVADGQARRKQILVFLDITLQAEQFGQLHNVPVGNVMLSTCSSKPASINFNRLAQAIVLQQGAVMQLKGGLQLRGAAAADHQAAAAGSSKASSSNSAGLLLLGSIDISAGAQLQLQDVTVAVADSQRVQEDMQQLANAVDSSSSSSSAAVSFGQLQGAAAGSSIHGFSVVSWSISLAGQALSGGRAEAATGARLTMQNVTVVQAAPACFPSSDGVATATSAAQLSNLMADEKVTMIEIASDMTLQPGRRQVPGGEQDVLELQRPLELRGCHPNSDAGGTYTLDFTSLKGKPVATVHAMLRISGDLTLRGIPDFEGAPGSWPLLPVVRLAQQGYLEFQGVLLQGKTESPLQNINNISSIWSSPAPGAAPGANVSPVHNQMTFVHTLLLPEHAAAQMFPPMFSGASGNSSTGYGYVNTVLHWDPSLSTAAAPAGRNLPPGSVAAVVLGAVLGLLLLGLLAVALLVLRQWRQQQAGSFAATGKGSIGWQLCWTSGAKRGSACSTSQNGMDDPGSLHTAENCAERGEGLCVGADHEALLQSFMGATGAHYVGRELSRQQLTAFAGTSMTSRIHSSGSRPRAQHGHAWNADQKQYDVQMQLQSGEADVYGRQTSGNCDADSRMNSYKLHQAGLCGHTTELHTTLTEDGTQPGVAEGGPVRGQHKQQVFEDARRRLGATAGDLARSDALVLESVLGEGTFGKVFKGYWKGTLVAVKTMMFPAAMSGKEKREKMAIMETAISASLSHPNIVQMYTYYLRPVLVGHEAQLSSPAGAEDAHRLDNSSVGDSTMNAAFLNEGLSDTVHSWEVQLVLEYCDQGSLRHLLNKKGAFTLSDGSRDMLLILDTALDVARAMLHLHSENIIHSDLKARNILLKSSGGADGRQFVAKVADFGLSMRIDPTATHVSNVYQGTMTHMAPEVMLQGKLSRGSDVYAFGVLLWELYSGGHAFKGIPRALLGHEVAHRQRRPQFPEDSPFDYQLLACRCWESDASIRPSFQEILAELQRMRERITASAASSSALTSDPISNPSAGLPAASAGAMSQPPAQGVTPVAESGCEQQQQATTAAAAAHRVPAKAASEGKLPTGIPAGGGDQAHVLANEGDAVAQQAGQTQQDAVGSDRRVQGKAGAAPAMVQGLMVQPQQQQDQQAGANQQPCGMQKMLSNTEGGTGFGATALPEGPLQGVAAAAAAGTGGLAVTAAGPGPHAFPSQQQQQQQCGGAMRQDSKESIPDHLLQQMSITVSCDNAWLNEAGGGVTGMVPPGPAGAAAAAAAGVACADRAGGTAQLGGDDVMSPQAPSNAASFTGGGGKSTYMQDTFSSTLDGAPHCVVYGAGHVLQSQPQSATESMGEEAPLPSAAAAVASSSAPQQEQLAPTVPAAAGQVELQQGHTAAAACALQQQQQQDRALDEKQARQDRQQEQQTQLSGASTSLSGSAGVLGKRMLPFGTARKLIQSSKADAVQSAPTTSSNTSTTALPTIENNVVARLSDVSPAPLPGAAAAAGATGPLAAGAAVASSRHVQGANRQQQQQQQPEERHVPVMQQLQQRLQQQQQQPLAQGVQYNNQEQDAARRPVIQQLQERLARRVDLPQQQEQQQQQAAGPSTPRQQQQHLQQQQQQQQWHPPEHLHHQQQLQRTGSNLSDAASASDNTSSDGVVHEGSSSSGNFAPSSSVCSSSTRPGAHSGSVAALQAVLLLKASLAKRAMSMQTPAGRPSSDLGQAAAGAAAAEGPASGPLPQALAAASDAGKSRSKSQPLPALPLPVATGPADRQLRSEISSAMTAASAAAAARAALRAPGASGAAASVPVRYSLDAQQAAAAAAGAWPSGIQPTARLSVDKRLEPVGRFSLDTRLSAGAAAADPSSHRQSVGGRFGTHVNAPAPAAAAAGAGHAGVDAFGRMSPVGEAGQQQQHRPSVKFAGGTVDAAAVDSRAVFGESGQHHRAHLRATASARAGFTGLAGQFDHATGIPSGGNTVAGAAAAAAAATTMQQPGSPSGLSPPVSPSARYHAAHHPAVRKAVSATQLGYHGTGQAAASLAANQWLASRLLSEPLGSLSSASKGSGGGQASQHPLHALPQLLQHAASGSTSAAGEPALNELVGLDADQLQLLAQIADAAKAQVQLPTTGLAKPTQTQPGAFLSGPLGLLSQGVPGPLSGHLPAGQSLSVDRAFTVLQQQQQHQQPAMQRHSLQLMPQQQPQQQQPLRLEAQHSRPPSHGAAQSPAGVDRASTALATAATSPQGSSIRVLRIFGQQQLPPLQQLLQGQGSKPRRASAPPQHPQPRERRPSAQPAASAAPDGRQFAKSRRASAPLQQQPINEGSGTFSDFVGLGTPNHGA